MVHTIRYARSAQSIVLTILLMLTLAACGGARTDAEPSTEQEASPETTLASPVPATNAGGPGIDQTKLDVCAMIPRDKVEAAIGALTEAPKKSIAIGNEVGCDYVVDQGRVYEITVYNLDRWELIPQIIDGAAATARIGDGAYEAKEVGGGTVLYMLLRDRAVVGARVNGANTPPFRQLLNLALAQVR